MRLENLNTYYFLVILAVVSVFAYKMFAPYISAIFVAAVIAVMLHRVYAWCVKKTGNRHALAATLSCFFALFVVILPVVGVAGVVTTEAVDLVASITTEGTTEQKLTQEFFENLKNTPVVQSVTQDPERLFSDEQTRQSLAAVGQSVATIVQKTSLGLVNFVVWLFVMFFTLFYFFIDGKRVVERIMFLSPLSDAHEKKLIGRFVSMTRATLKGTVVIGFAQGVLGGLVFWIAGVASPALWTVVMIVLSIIPAVGAALVMVPVGVVLVLLGSVWQGVLILVAAVIISSVDNIMRPKLVGKDTQMHTLLIFFATLGGLSVFGLIGFVVGPIIMALFLAMWEIYGEEFRGQLKKYNQ